MKKEKGVHIKSGNYCEEERKGWDCNSESGARGARVDVWTKTWHRLEAGAAHWEEHAQHGKAHTPCRVAVLNITFNNMCTALKMLPGMQQELINGELLLA